jgi:tRNA-specific 2-thiouridylase
MIRSGCEGIVKNSSHPDGTQSRASVKAIAATSGGLDSLLAAEIVRRAGVDVVLLHVQHLFSGGSEARDRLREAAARMGMPLRIVDGAADHLEVVRRPKHGYGRGVNPCVDCRIFVLRVAGRVMAEENAQFVVTGEVLGQRPRSQQIRALMDVAAESGLGDRLIRPLSANLLPDTLPVTRGWIVRDRLFAIRGRSREPQVELARRLGVVGYPQPAGGCLLTEPAYAKRVRDAFEHVGRDAMGVAEFRLLGLGRHFRISAQAKAIVGRHRTENEALDAFRRGRIRLEPIAVMGPTALVEGQPGEEDVHLAAALAARYCDVPPGETVSFDVAEEAAHRTVSVVPLSSEDPRIAVWRIA